MGKQYDKLSTVLAAIVTVAIFTQLMGKGATTKRVIENVGVLFQRSIRALLGGYDNG